MIKYINSEHIACVSVHMYTIKRIEISILKGGEQ